MHLVGFTIEKTFENIEELSRGKRMCRTFKMNAIYTRPMSQKVDGDADVTKSTGSGCSDVLIDFVSGSRILKL